ncbi:MAG: ABC transporter [Ignavibacteriae bacterium HGW-Ignavibacteriae-3]|nr:MAG: ABC transporter [Ignavibacteriae bacterium HGW-Ignavibacteriae-3]
MLVVDNISLKAGTFELTNITFTVDQGDYFVILGISGVGKSLLLESIAGLIKINSGNIYLRGKNISEEKIQKRNISIVYQDTDLFPHLTVFENIAYPLRSKREKDIEEKVLKTAELVGVSDKLSRKPDTLSGGEYQRVALARSLAADNDIFLLDEPLSSLDAKSKRELRALLRKLNRSGITIIHVTHDYEEAVSLAGKIGIMEKGNLVHVATPENIFKHPKSEFVAQFIGIKNFLPGKLKSLPQSDLKEFIVNETRLFCLTEADDGDAFLLIQPEEISISNSAESGSARNHFEGEIIDIARAKIGVEVTVDIGCEVVALISAESMNSLGLKIGNRIWTNFKASACRIYN